MAAFIDLVFSGGGTRGVALAGAVEILEQKRPIVRRVIGTSAGAIAAASGAAGFLSKEYLKLVPSKPGDPFLFNAFFAPPKGEAVRESAAKKESETRLVLRTAVDAASDKFLEGIAQRRPRIGELLQGAFALGKQPFYEAAFEKFLDRVADPNQDPEKARPTTLFFSLLEFGGIFDPQLFRDWFVTLFREKIKNFSAATTLKQFHDMTRDVGRELSVVATDATESRPLVLNHRTAPDCPVAEAVLSSLSVPFVWPEVEWKKEWGTYLGEEIAGHYLIDGAVMANFPLQYLLNREQETVRRIFGEPEKEPSTVIGLFLDASLPVPGDVAPAAKPPFKIMERIERLMGSLMAWQWDGLQNAESAICRIGTKGHPSLELQKTPEAIERLQALVNSGRCAMVDHIKKRKLF